MNTEKWKKKILLSTFYTNDKETRIGQTWIEGKVNYDLITGQFFAVDEFVRSLKLLLLLFF